LKLAGSPGIDTIAKTSVKVDISPPRDHKVIYINDEVTPMDYVITSMMNIFEHDFDTADMLTSRIHEEGSAVVAVLPYELAEHKGVEATIDARSNGWPLLIKIQPE
jgi:ATP-dependent Clp protease adaptor protein ClpS